MIWEDLMWACNTYAVPPEYLSSAAKEIQDNVKRMHGALCTIDYVTRPSLLAKAVQALAKQLQHGVRVAGKLLRSMSTAGIHDVAGLEARPYV
jgi:hypothetical protein